jgi:TPP-dependent pyruvate/acetoin dehydrogenase alpha subunit
LELTKNELICMYRRMVEIRIFEQSLTKFYEEGLLVGTGHPSMGEEAVAVGACFAVENDDYVLSTHRAHGHILAKGASMPIILAELFARATGCTGGKGGSMHVSDLEHGFIASTAIVGSGIGIGGGVGLGIKLKETRQVCLSFFGDGASNRGTFHEALNLASLWKVPTVFICTNNQYAVSVPQCKSCANVDISARASSYAMTGVRIDGTDVIAVYEAVREAAGRARRGEGPTLIEAITYRLSLQHSMRAVTVPGTEYRQPGEFEEWWDKHDPVKIFRLQLSGMGYLDSEQAEQIESEAKEEFGRAVQFAIQSPQPKIETAYEHIYNMRGAK